MFWLLIVVDLICFLFLHVMKYAFDSHFPATEKMIRSYNYPMDDSIQSLKISPQPLDKLKYKNKFLILFCPYRPQLFATPHCIAPT